MKKTLIALALMAAATMASAYDLTLNAGRNEGASRNTAGLALGTKVGIGRAELTVDHVYGARPFNTVGVNGSLPITTLGPVALSAKVGASFLDTPTVDGYAVRGGLEATYPLTQKVSLVGNYAYQRAESKLRAYNGNQISVGLRYAF